MRNEYKIKGDYVIIYLNRRNGEVYETLIDLEDLEKIEKIDYTFYPKYYKNIDGFYAVATEYLGYKNGKPKYGEIRLHKIIMNYYDNKKHIDHINHNTLDNRKSNLRLTEVKKNLKNRKSKNSNNTTGYRNVSYIKSKNKYIVQLQIDGKNTILGEFDDVHEAGKFANKMREKHYKSYKGKN